MNQEEHDKKKQEIFEELKAIGNRMAELSNDIIRLEGSIGAHIALTVVNILGACQVSIESGIPKASALINPDAEPEVPPEKVDIDETLKEILDKRKNSGSN